MVPARAADGDQERAAAGRVLDLPVRLVRDGLHSDHAVAFVADGLWITAVVWQVEFPLLPLAAEFVWDVRTAHEARADQQSAEFVTTKLCQPAYRDMMDDCTNGHRSRMLAHQKLC